MALSLGSKRQRVKKGELKMICNKALKITNKDIIYAQTNRGYSDNLELNLYLKFGNEEPYVGTFQPVDFDLNYNWYEIDEIKGLISDYLEDEEADYEVINYE
ncbi:MAG: hypothetical protein OHM56_05460 [Spiroplasma phoeniceum]|nr:MAG: hypothetical protein OHM57_04865 [Spiroplasma phoeniceum]UZQ33373.1 MAG: hypothetical protein OHM56_05460 [Spiroplasma phoeniceum]